MKLTKEELTRLIRESVAETVEERVRQAVDELGLREVENRILGVSAIKYDPEKAVMERMGQFFKSVLATGQLPKGFQYNAHDQAVLRDLSAGTATAGGNLIPDEFVAEMIKRLPDLSELYPYVRKMPVARLTGTLPSLSTDVSATWTTTENTDQGETNPAFGTVTWSIRKLIMYTDFSNELLEDAAVNVANEVTQLFIEKGASERDRVIAIGNGSTEPQGIFSASITQSVSIGSLSFAKLVQLEHTLPKKYRANARWVMENSLVRKCMALVDSQNRPIFQRDPTGKNPPTLLGYPISQQDDGPTTDIAFGNLSHYIMFQRAGVTVATDSSGAAFKADQSTIRFRERMDGKVVLAAGFAQGTNIA